MIAIVEDNKDIASLWKLTLSQDQDVLVFSEGTSAMEYGGWDSVRGAILDVALGAESPTGVDVARFLQEFHPHIKLVIVTAQPVSDIPEDLRVTTLQKPCSLSEIKTAMEGSTNV